MVVIVEGVWLVWLLLGGGLSVTVQIPQKRLVLMGSVYARTAVNTTALGVRFIEHQDRVPGNLVFYKRWSRRLSWDAYFIGSRCVGSSGYLRNRPRVLP
jgi:hypothetical protein